MNWNTIAKTTFGIFFVTQVVLLANECSAAMFSFERITSNGAENPESQISVDVSDSGGRILFKFSNPGPMASNITEIYWDDDAPLLSNGPDIDAASTSAGAIFLANAGTDPSNLPGGNGVGFSADHAIDSQNGNGNGINPGEMAGFLFDGNANSVISAIQAGSLRLGMHVRSIGTGGQSEGFVNLVPEPTSLTLLTVGIIDICARRRV
jgi:hypothetical protein